MSAANPSVLWGSSFPPLRCRSYGGVSSQGRWQPIHGKENCMTLEILLVESDPLVRDHIKVGLQQFPECSVTVASGYSGVNELRDRRFDCVFLGIDLRNKESAGLLAHLRGFDSNTEVIVVTAARNVKDMAADKGRFDVHTFLRTPIDPAELFRCIGRFRERHANAGEQQADSTPRPKGKRAGKGASR
ncbi:MAG: response regulator [Planctomycetes bacterium]|nr:response regulator [Planctomycetota bacterium]